MHNGHSPGVRVATTVICGIALAATSAAQSRSSNDHRPDIEFHAPFHTSAAESKDEFREKYFLGDWLGMRSKLANRGMQFALLSITDPFGNVTGGKQRGASDYSLVGIGVLLDTAALLGWQGGTFHVGFATNFGTSLSRNYVGNNFPVQLADVADAHPRLTYFSYTQEMFEQKLSVRFGRLTINSVSHEEFLGSEYFKVFTSVGVDLVPLGIFFNAPGAFGYPDTTWGARVKFQPSTRFYTMGGVYNGDPTVKEGIHHGLDFSMRGPPFFIGEVGLRWNDPKSSASSSNLKVGGYDNNDGRYGFYVLGDQALLRWGDSGQNRHLGAFGAFIFAPNQSVNRVPYFFDTGMVAYGPFRSRPKDLAGFVVVYGGYSRGLRRASIGLQQFEMTLEGNYGVALRPGLLLQPDVQYLVHPSGSPTTPNALAIGVNIVVNW